MDQLRPKSQPRRNGMIELHLTGYPQNDHLPQQPSGHTYPLAQHRREALDKGAYKSLHEYRQQLTHFMDGVAKPPSASSSGSTIEDTEEDHEAALELCLGSGRRSSAQESNNPSATSGKPRTKASVALAESNTRTSSVADHPSYPCTPSNTITCVTNVTSEPTVSSNSSILAKRIRSPEIESTPLRDSKRIRTASTSQEQRCSSGAAITIEGYADFLEEQSKTMSAYEDKDSCSWWDTVMISDVPETPE